MATRDRFAPNNSLPLFLSEGAEVAERSETRRIAVVATIGLVFTTAAFLFALISVRTPLALFANAKASASTSSQDAAAPPAPTIRSSASAQALEPVATEAPTGGELLTAFKSAFEKQTDQPPAGNLLHQFQDWATEENVQANVQPPHPVEDARAQVLEKARAPLPKPRPIQTEHTVRQLAPPLSPVQHFGWRN